MEIHQQRPQVPDGFDVTACRDLTAVQRIRQRPLSKNDGLEHRTRGRHRRIRIGGDLPSR